MKKILLLLLSVVLVFSLVACGNEENPDPSGSENPGVSQSGENNEDQGGGITKNGTFCGNFYGKFPLFLKKALAICIICNIIRIYATRSANSGITQILYGGESR